MRTLHPSWAWLVVVAVASSVHGQSVVTPTGVTLDASSEFYPLINLVNGSGLSDTPTLTNINSVTHAGSPETLWVTDDPEPGGGDYYAEGNPIPTMTFSFDQAYDFTHVVTWGYTVIGNDSKAITVEFSTNGGATFPMSVNIERNLANAGTGVADMQSLGGTFNANAVRFQITDNFLEAGAGGDRVGLGEVRFLEGVTGFVNLEINRDNGAIMLRNDSASAINFAGLGMTSAVGALDPASWLSVADNYDEGGSVSADEWIEFSASNSDLSEGTLGTGTLGVGQTVNLGTSTWLRNPTEDVVFTYLDANTGERVSIDINYVGANQTEPYAVGDLNFDGDVDELDWPTYRNGYRKDLTGMSITEGYQMGDLNGDGINNAVDFGLFKAAYEANNPGASFAAMIAGSPVPEPSTISLLAVVGLIGMRLVVRRTGEMMNCKNLTLGAALGVLAATAAVPQAAQAELVAHYEFENSGNIGLDSAGGDNNGTALGSDVSFASGRVGSSSLAIDATGIGLELANPTTFQPLTTFTIASFVRPSFDGGNWGNGSGVGRVFGALGIDADGNPIPDTTTSGYGFGVINNGQLRYTTYGVQDYNQTAGVVNNQWQHIAVVVAEGNATFYLDGANVGMIAGANPTATMNPYHIGASAISNSDRFLGLIDDLRVYDNALNDAQILALASVPEPTLTLEVDTVTGLTRLLNNESFAFDIDQYEILTNTSDATLNPSGWDSITTGTGFPTGNGSGNGWETLGAPTTSFLGEGYLQGSSEIADGASIVLGNAYDPSVLGAGVDGNLDFNFRTSDGTLKSGIVTYVTGAAVAGDYNGNGIVDAADYTLWRDTLGSTSDLRADGNDSGTVDPGDYQFWKERFGNTSGSGSLNAAAVPEPSTAVLAMIAVMGAIYVARHRPTGVKLFSPAVIRTAGLGIVAWAVVGSAALATVTLDRDYTFGEDSLEGPSQGAIIGSNNTAPLAAGDTADGIGPTGAFLDLTQSGGATYQNVGPGGLARPGAAAGEFGVRFDGVDDRLDGTPLNRPDELASLPCCGGYPLNYNGITGHGLQGWVYPNSLALGSPGSPTTFQSIVFDTIFSGGPAINAQGQWTQINSFHSDGADAVPATIDVPAGNTWYHVMHHHYLLSDPNAPRPVPGSASISPFTSVLFVDGVAVSANNDTINTGGDPAYVGKLVVGAAEKAGDGLSAVYGNHFSGVVDDLEMYVYGNNQSQGGQNYGTFDLFADNEWIRNTIDNDPVLQGTLTPGDINKDGAVNGDGTGPVGSDDVSAFVAGWGSRNLFQGAHNTATAGDWLTWENGDLNHDGVTDFADWFILRANHPTPASLNLAALLGGGESVPEPSSLAMAALAVAGCLLVRWRR